MAVSDRAPAQALDASGIPLVVVAITSLQFGAALAGTIFDEIGPAGTALLRALFAAAILMLVWRPSLRGHSARDVRLVALFGLVLGAMNLCIYESFARIPLGIAVTIEFAGPLAVAAALSRRRLDLAAVALAAVGIVLLADPGGGAVDAVGVAFALVAAAGWAAYILIAQARIARLHRRARPGHRDGLRRPRPPRPRARRRRHRPAGRRGGWRSAARSR